MTHARHPQRQDHKSKSKWGSLICVLTMALSIKLPSNVSTPLLLGCFIYLTREFYKYCKNDSEENEIKSNNALIKSLGAHVIISFFATSSPISLTPHNLEKKESIFSLR